MAAKGKEMASQYKTFYINSLHLQWVGCSDYGTVKTAGKERETGRENISAFNVPTKTTGIDDDDENL